MHHYFHLQGFTDLDKIRGDARWLLKGGWSGKNPEESIIHLHRYEESDCRLMNIPGPHVLKLPEWSAYAVSVSDQHEWYTFDMEEQR